MPLHTARNDKHSTHGFMAAMDNKLMVVPTLKKANGEMKKKLITSRKKRERRKSM